MAKGFVQWRSMLQDAAEESVCSTGEVLLALGQAVEQRDPHTGAHCQRMAYLALMLGDAMGLDRESLLALYQGGHVHDIGKVGIPDGILLKPGALTTSEWVTMRAHTTCGVEICRHVKSMAKVLPIIRSHHERLDGSGYPDGLKGQQIPLLARVMQVVDIYDALISPRPYRSPCPPETALEILAEETTRGWRDPEIVAVFLELHDGSLGALRESVVAGGLAGFETAARDAEERIDRNADTAGRSSWDTDHASGHTFFRRPRHGPASDSRAAVRDRSRRA